MKDKAIIVCDNCGKEFNNFEILEDELNNGEIRRSYIKCPRCNKEYIILLEDEEIRELKKEYQKFLEKHIALINAKAPLEEIQISFKELKTYVKQVKDKSRLLEQKYLGGNDE